MDNTNLIRKIAWSFHYSTGVDWNDLFQEANIAYYTALKTHDPNRGKITTHAWVCITNHLKNYLKEQEEYKYTMISLEEMLPTHHPAQVASDFWESLTEDAKQISNLILASPKKYVVLTSKQAEERIEHIMNRQGWTEKKIKNGLHDLKLACQ